MFKFSIITVCYNANDSISKTIESVLSQNFESVEYIIIDGRSTDGTVEIIKQYENKIDKFISEPDNGIYDAMNKGSRYATGDWILFMNSGDTFANENVLKDVAEKIQNESDVVYGDNLMVYKSKTIYHKAKFFSKWDINLPFNHQSSFVRTKLARENPFDLKYKIAGDYNFFYNLYKSEKKFQYIPIPIANYAMDGMSQDHVIKTFKEVCEIQKKKKNFNYLLALAYLRLKLIGQKLLPNTIVNTCRAILNG